MLSRPFRGLFCHPGLVGRESMLAPATLSQNFFDRPIAFFHQFHRSPNDLEFHLLVVESELLKNGRVQIAVIMPFLDRCVAHLVGGAVDGAALDAAAGQPDRVALWIVIAAGRVLRPRTAAELAAP